MFASENGRYYDREGVRSLAGMLELAYKKFGRGEPIFREAALFREESVAGLLNKIPKCDWFSELAEDETFRRSSAMGTMGDLQSTLIAWVSLKLREISDTSNWFRPSPQLTYKLLATDLRGAVVADLKLPYESFYVEMPPDVLYLEDKRTGWHEVRSLTVTRGRITEKSLEVARRHGDESVNSVRLGSRLLIEAYGEPNKNSAGPFDDTWLFKSYPIVDEIQDIESMIEQSIRDSEYEKHLNRGRVGERILDGLELRTFLFKFVLNFCVYLGSEKITVKHEHADELEKILKGKKRKNLRKSLQDKVKRLENDRVFLVGSEVSIDPELKEFVRTEGTGSFQLSYRTLVRGHWRNQAHGPARTLRKKKWIEPHIRGAELPTKRVGHRYNVK